MEGHHAVSLFLYSAAFLHSFIHSFTGFKIDFKSPYYRSGEFRKQVPAQGEEMTWDILEKCNVMFVSCTFHFLKCLVRFYGLKA
jgi:hypothetical protein